MKFKKLILTAVVGVLTTVPSLSFGEQYVLYRDGNGVIHITSVPGSARPVSKAAVKQGKSYETTIMRWSHSYNLDPDLIKEVIKVESNFDTLARSPKGAAGLMQLMPETCRLYGVFNPYSPEENIRGGSAHLRDLIDRYGGDLKLALAAYNSGVGNVDRYGTVPPYLETRKYVEKILSKYDKNQPTAPIYRVKSTAGQVVLTNRPELYPDWRKEALR